MPVTKLLVEGDLDAQLLSAVCAGSPVVEGLKSSKNALAPRTRVEREKGISGVFFCGIGILISTRPELWIVQRKISRTKDSPLLF